VCDANSEAGFWEERKKREQKMGRDVIERLQLGLFGEEGETKMELRPGAPQDLYLAGFPRRCRTPKTQLRSTAFMAGIERRPVARHSARASKSS